MPMTTETTLTTAQKDGQHFYDLFWQHSQKHIYQKTGSVHDIYKACQYLVTANLMGHIPAKAALLAGDTYFLAHEFQTQLDNEFKARLLENNRGKSHYTDSRNSLFLIEYAKKYRTVYTDYADRFKDIFSALNYLGQAWPALHGKLKQFADSMGIQFPLTYQAQKAASWQLLIHELIGQDPMLDKQGQLGSSYPFRIKAPEQFEEFIAQAVTDKNSRQQLLQHYRQFIAESVQITSVKKLANGQYLLEIDPKQLRDNGITSFLDATTQQEIARIEKSGDSLTFTGFGDKFTLKTKQALDCESFILTNKNGEVKLISDLEQTKPLYLSSDMAVFRLEGKINSTDVIRIDSRGKVQLPTETALTSDQAIFIRTDDLELRGLTDSKANVHLEVNGELLFSDQAKVLAKNDIALKVGLIKDFRGDMTAEGMLQVVCQDGINLHGAGKLYGKKGLAVNARTLMSTDKAVVKTDNIGILKIYGKLVMDKETTWEATAFKIRAESTEATSPHIKAERIDIHSSDTTRIHPQGKITTTHSLILTGDSVWNGGVLDFGKILTMKLNKFYVHGISQLSVSNLREAVKHSCLSGENVNIIAGVVVGALGSTYATTRSIAALATVGADFSVTKYNKKSRLIALECSVDLPNLRAIYQDIQDCMVKFKDEKYADALKSFVTLNAFNNVLSVARWVVRILQPAAGKLVDLIWSCIMMFANMPSLYQECKLLYQKHEKGETIEPSDLYKLIAIAGGIGVQAFNLESLVVNTVASGFGDFSAAGDPSDIPALAASFASLFMPSTMDDAVVSFSAGGISANGSLTQRSVVSYAVLHSEIALNTTHVSQYSVENTQLTMANNVSNMGGSLTRSGYELASNDVTNLQQQTESSTILANKVQWQANTINDNAHVMANIIQVAATDNLNHQGNFQASHLTSLSANHLTTSENSHTNAENVVINADSVHHQGHTHSSQLVIKGTGSVELAVGSQNEAEHVYIKGHDVFQNGDITIPASAPLQTAQKKDTEGNEKAEPAVPNIYISADNIAKTGEQSHMNAPTSDILFSGKDVEINGYSNTRGLHLLGTDTVKLDQTSESIAQLIYAKANEIFQNGEIKLNNLELKKFTKQPTTDATKADETKEDEPNYELNLLFDAVEKIIVGQASNISGDNAVILFRAKLIEDDGYKNVARASELAADKLIEDIHAETHAKHIELEAEEMELGGHSVIHGGSHEEKEAKSPDYIAHGKKVTLKNSSQIDADGGTVAVSGDDLRFAGKLSAHDIFLSATQSLIDESHIAASTLFEAGKTIITTTSATHDVDGVRYQAEQASLQGTTHADLMTLAIDHGLDVKAILSGNATNLQAKQTLAIETKDAVTLDQNYQFDKNISVTAAAITVNNKDISSNHSLELKTTNGDLSISHSQVHADQTLALDSSGQIMNDQSSLTADIVSAHAVGDITNFAGHMQANTYLQVKSDQGNVRNVGYVEYVKQPVNVSVGLKDLFSKLHVPLTREVPVYHGADMSGGNGIDGFAVDIEAGGKLVNQGTIHSQSGIFINAKQGIDNIDLTYSSRQQWHFGIAHFLAARMPAPQHRVSAEISGQGQVALQTDGSINNSYSLIQGGVTSLQAGGDIINHAGMISGSQHVLMKAGGNIENQSVSHDIQGRYSLMKAYDIGHIYGGSDGIDMEAGGQVRNYASEIVSLGNINISGKKGIFSIADYNEYISYERESSTWYGKKSKTTEYSYQVQPSLIYSVNGSNTLVSEEGGIYSLSTNFIAAKDNNFSAHDPIKLYGLVLQTTTIKNKSSLWGLSSERSRQVDDAAVPTVIMNPANTRIVSLSDVDMPNTFISAGGNVDIQGKNINISAPTLNHSYSLDTRGFSFSTPLLSPGSASPLPGDYLALRNSQNGTELAANAWNMALDGATAANNLMTGMRSGTTGSSFFSQFASVGITYGHNQFYSKQETIAGNVGIQAGNLSLHADNELTLGNGIPVSVLGNADIHARLFNQTGAKLSGSTRSSSQSVTLGLSLTADPTVGVAASGNTSRSTTYANQTLNVGGNLTVEADQWNLTDANVFANSLDATVGSLSVISHLNTSSSHGWSASLSTDGNVSAMNASGHSALLGLASGLNIAGEMHLRANNADLVGGKIIGGDGSTVDIQHVRATSVDQYNKSNSFGASANLNDFSGSSSSTGNVSVAVGYDNYEASQQSTIYIPNKNNLHVGSVSGDLNTADANGLNVSSDDHLHVQVKVPIYNVATTKEFKQNLAWASGLFSASTPTTTPVKTPIVHLPESKAEEAKASRISRWQGEEYDGLKDDATAAKWADALFTTPTFEEPHARQTTYEDSTSYMDRLFGLGQCIGGGLQVIGGVVGGVATAETGVGAAIGAFVFMRGVDNFKAGLYTVMSGKPTRTNLGELLASTGMSDGAIMLTEGALDIFGPGELNNLSTAIKYDKYLTNAATRNRIYENIGLNQQAMQNSLYRIHGVIENSLTLDVSAKSPVFWSNEALGNKVLGRQFAEQTGRTTLEMTPGGQYLESLDFLKDYSYADKIRPWEISSRRFAENASGDVYAFVNGSSANSIFRRIELPALRENNVNIITPNFSSTNGFKP